MHWLSDPKQCILRQLESVFSGAKSSATEHKISAMDDWSWKMAQHITRIGMRSVYNNKTMSGIYNNLRVSNIMVSNRTLIYNVCPKSALT